MLPIKETELAPKLTPGATEGVHKGGMHKGGVEGGMHEGDMHENDTADKEEASREACTKGNAEGGIANNDDENDIADKEESGKDACDKTETSSKDKGKKTKISHKAGDIGMHGKAVPAKYRRLLLNTEVLPIKEAELVPKHTPDAAGSMHEGGMHKSGVADKDKASQEACTESDAESDVANEGDAGKEAYTVVQCGALWGRAR